MSPTPLHQTFRRLRDELEGGTSPKKGGKGRLHALAEELRASSQDAPPEVAAAVDAVLALLEEPVPADASGHAALLSRELSGLERALAVQPVEALLDPETLRGFLEDRADSVEEIEDRALALEQSGDREHLDEIKRIVHSVKGDAGVLGLHDLSGLCHSLEDALQGASPEVAAQLCLGVAEKMRARFASLQGSAGPQTASEPEVEAEAEPEIQMPEPDTVPDIDQELAAEFVVEAREHLEAIDAGLLHLESVGDEEARAEAINAIFRAFHTVKGLSGFLNLEIIQGLAHEAEALLDRVRSAEIPLSAAIVEACFQVCDALKGLIGVLEHSLASGDPIPPPANYARLMALLFAAGDPGAASSGPADPLPLASAEEGDAESESSEPDAERASRPPGSGRTIESAIKVDATRLDQLIDTIGELVIAEAMVSQCEEMRGLANGRLAGLLGQLDKTTRELQELAMSLRMVPIRPTFRRMARLARDVSRKLGKRIELTTRGDETELDKTVVDVIGDPLVHMVRNAIDHGIEKSHEEREAAGKPSAGRIELRAFHQGGSIHVEIEDDGRGLNRDVILAKARAKGVVNDDGKNLSDSEVWNLIFAPGFSTAESVTEVSGRGVGLDVVRRNIESLRGQVEIRSKAGQGSVFSIRLPLTLAIIDGMVVQVGTRQFIIPTLSIIRMFRPNSAEMTRVLDRGRLLRVGDELVPLHRLDEVFGLPRSEVDLTEQSALVVESPAGHFAFTVDELVGQQQIVIKPLSTALAGIRGLAGGAIMPNGMIGLIIDIAGLAEVASARPQATRKQEQRQTCKT